MKGLDLSKEGSLGGDELHLALNVDFGPDGSIKGRPSRIERDQFYVLSSALAASAEPTYLAAQDFDDTGFTPMGLMRVKDGAGERPALATQGRLFINEGTKWHDRGAFGCMRVDRTNGNPDTLVVTTPASMRRTTAPDFSHCKTGTAIPAASEVWALFNSAGALEQRDLTPGTGTFTPGTGTRKGTMTAVVAVADTTNNFLDIYYRDNGTPTLVPTTLASDARTPTDVGDAPVICPAASSSHFYVAYRTTTANVFKVLKVDMNGVTIWTYTSGVIAGLAGLWVDNSAGNVCVAFTNASGLTVRQLDPTLGTVTGSDATDTTGAGADCVIGVESATQARYAYRAGASEDIVVGYVSLAAFTCTVQRTFRGASAISSTLTLRWGICHQPLKLNGRMYLTLSCCAGGAAATATATWLTLDLSSWFTTTTLATGPFPNPTIVARGPTAGTYPHKQPCPAAALSDSSGFTFPTQDWTAFKVSNGFLAGVTAVSGVNKVSFSKPRVATLGETVVFSGSVPRMIGRGDCVELGWPFLAGEPAVAVQYSAGGSIPDGDYSVKAVWKWTDEAGQIHRSAPSQSITQTTGSGNNTLICSAVAPWLTEKASRVVVEFYVNSLSALTTYTLQGSYTWPGFSAAPSVSVTLTSLSATAEELYSDGDVLPNYHVPGDGGVTAVGRRLWMADASRVYATKLWTTGYGPEFNDDAAEDQPSLYVNIPANAGRVVALENLDDKLVVFCERGVYLIQDGGPSNTGAGADFAPPLRISDLSIAGPRSSCSTDSGILFCTALDTIDTARGGPWLIDRQFTFTERQFLGRQAQSMFLRTEGWVPEVAYSPERQQAFITTNNIDIEQIEMDPCHGVVVIDFRLSKWAAWQIHDGVYGDLRSICTVGGSLWALNDQPSAFSGAPGVDVLDSTSLLGYSMYIATSHLAANGADGAGWSRVRSITPIQAEGSGSHTLVILAIMDQTRTLSSGNIAVAATAADTTWPTTRQVPEWRLPSQKCSTLQVLLAASATARWAAIRLDVAPLPLKVPAKNRT
jgi:hypothetical protein